MRPILSDSQPNKMKNGVPIRSAEGDQKVRGRAVHLQRLGEEEQRVELARIPDHGLTGGAAEEGDESRSWRCPSGRTLR